MKNCSYCGAAGKMSNEHIFPKFIYKAQKEMDNCQYFLRQDAFINAELKIGDVCVECNTRPLSELDDYVTNLYREYFQNIVRKNMQIKFQYDFDQLGRWLLKVAYNSARANNTDCSCIDQSIKDYILTGSNRPENMTIFLQLVIPHKLTEQELQKAEYEEFREHGEIPPLFTRIMYNQMSLPGVRFIRGIALYSYYFYIVLGDSNISPHLWQKKASDICKHLNYPHILQPDKNEDIIKASKITMHQATKDHIYKTKEVYQDYVAKK